MAFKFDIDESFANEIPRVARERIDRVTESLTEKPRPSAESIHSARKDLKSLRALLRLARGSIANDVRQGENLIFRDIGRSLSALRDSQALVEALKKFAKGKSRTNSKNSVTQKEARSEFIQKVRNGIEQGAVKELPDETLKQLKENLHGASRSVADWLDLVSFEPEDEWEVFVGRGLRRTYRQGKNLVSQLETLGKENAGDETWHELRKSAKALGYQMRLLRPIWPELTGPLLEQFDQLTDRLGDDHDLVVLRGRLLNEPYKASETQKAADVRRNLIDSLERRRRKLQMEAFKIARRIYAEKPRQFESRIRSYWRLSQAKRPGRDGAPEVRHSEKPASQKRTALQSKKGSVRPPCPPARSRSRVTSGN